MIKTDVLAALNRQVQQELTASYRYLAMAAWFELQTLKGFARYFRKQAEEEREHAMRFLDYILGRSSTPNFGPLEAPRAEYGSVLDAVKQAQTSERQNTQSIHALYSLAVKQDDPATQNHLQWFISEQVEEEKWADEFVAMVEKIGPSVGSLYMLDHHVGKRVDKE